MQSSRYTAYCAETHHARPTVENMAGIDPDPNQTEQHRAYFPHLSSFYHRSTKHTIRLITDGRIPNSKGWCTTDSRLCGLQAHPRQTAPRDITNGIQPPAAQMPYHPGVLDTVVIISIASMPWKQSPTHNPNHQLRHLEPYTTAAMTTRRPSSMILRCLINMSLTSLAHWTSTSVKIRPLQRQRASRRSGRDYRQYHGR